MYGVACTGHHSIANQISVDFGVRWWMDRLDGVGFFDFIPADFGDNVAGADEANSCVLAGFCCRLSVTSLDALFLDDLLDERFRLNIDSPEEVCLLIGILCTCLRKHNQKEIPKKPKILYDFSILKLRCNDFFQVTASIGEVH